MSEFANDFLHRFELERAGVRGVLVRMDTSWQQVRERAVGGTHRDDDTEHEVVLHSDTMMPRRAGA